MSLLNLQQTSPIGKQRQGAATAGTLVLNKLKIPTIAILIGLVLALGFKTAYSDRVEHPFEATPGISKTSGQHSRELALVEAVYLDHQKGTHKSKDWVTDQLRKSQAGSLPAVKDTEAVWLNQVMDQDASVSIAGTAVSSQAVATLIADLDTTGYCKNIEIRETYQDDKKDNPAFQFALTCDFANRKP